jgi:hypothetical protein
VSVRLKNLFSKPCQTVSAAQAAALADDGAVLLDVREPHEWQASHAPRARHIPLGQLARRAAELPEHRAVVTVRAYQKERTYVQPGGRRPLARRSPGAGAAPTRVRSWPASPPMSGVPVPEPVPRLAAVSTGESL